MLSPRKPYLVADNVTVLPSGVYQCRLVEHALVSAHVENRRADFAAARRQGWVAEVPAVVGFTAAHARTAKKYGERV